MWGKETRSAFVSVIYSRYFVRRRKVFTFGACLPGIYYLWESLFGETEERYERKSKIVGCLFGAENIEDEFMDKESQGIRIAKKAVEMPR